MQWWRMGVLIMAITAAAGAELDRKGLALWLDAADLATVQRDGDAVVRWRDKSGAGHDAVADPQRRPTALGTALGGKPAVRFSGGQALLVPAIREAAGPAAIFIVSQRGAEQAARGGDWQRVLSIQAPGADRDNKDPGLALLLPADGKTAAYGPTVREVLAGSMSLAPLTIGRSALGTHQGFEGDIAEILVYDRPLFSEEAVRAVIDYLCAKWGAKSARAAEGWTRVGPLGDTPQRVSELLPLSDQTNKAGWTPVKDAWDEFDGPVLDATRWTPTMWYWKGRAPALFNPANVTQQKGCLQVTMRKQNLPAMAEDPQYKDYTSAVVISTRRYGYGYYEVRAKPMASAGSSSFWFQHTGIPGYGTEIDVFELGALAKGFERKYNMNVHVDRKETGAKYSDGGMWEAPFRFVDDFHVFGLDWSKDELVYYVDGVAVRRITNRDCHEPMLIIFDSETMPEWFGMPEDKDLPSTFEVDYLRAWRR
ncbi:MAG: family 16 glycosylhydrolase [Armatimonadetes bacterium]|nr:family 16 glycosylhydrolase [Armatimonadota bacterium]